MVLGLFGVSWVMPKSVVGLLACWQSRFGRYRNGHIWIIIPNCLMWCLWRERNNSCFEDSERSISDLKLFFFKLFWIGCLPCETNHSLLSLIFLDSCCNFCIWPLYTLCVLGCPFLISINLITYQKSLYELYGWLLVLNSLGIEWFISLLRGLILLGSH